MTGRPRSGDVQAGPFGHARGRQYDADQVKFFTIAEVAERLHVCTRTVRRWIERGDLIAHRWPGVVRISEADFRAFLALHREG